MASVVIAVASAALGFGAMAAGITTGMGIALAVASVAVGMVGNMIAKSKCPRTVTTRHKVTESRF